MTHHNEERRPRPGSGAHVNLDSATVTRTAGARHVDALAEYAPPLPAHRRCTIAVRCPYCGYVECRFAELDELLAGLVVRRCRRTGLRYRVIVAEVAVVAA